MKDGGHTCASAAPGWSGRDPLALHEKDQMFRRETARSAASQPQTSDARFQKGSRSLNVSQFKATGRPENVLCLGPDLADGPGQARG